MSTRTLRFVVLSIDGLAPSANANCQAAARSNSGPLQLTDPSVAGAPVRFVMR
jgi:hypothetical protein